MIHIGTVHHRDDRWIDVQLRYLERHTREPYRVYASLDGIDARYRSRFHHTLEHSNLAIEGRQMLRIERKLTLLAGEMVREAAPDDLLVFIHGDTFPITDWVGAVRRLVAESRLAAIRRDEIGEPIPHWSFCATTAGFWTEIRGDWTHGPTWDENGRQVTDTGTRLWETLDRRGIAWHPILRSNRTNLHPLWFGVYGGIVYHHGGGFRTPITRYDAAAYRHLPIPLRNFAGVRRRIANTLISRRMHRRIRDDERFYLELTSEST